MKKRELDKRPKECGWYFFRQGGRHELWTNGEHVVAVPRHKEIDENMARIILKEAIMHRKTIRGVQEILCA